jgi:hypothetical protein
MKAAAESPAAFHLFLPPLLSSPQTRCIVAKYYMSCFVILKSSAPCHLFLCKEIQLSSAPAAVFICFDGNARAAPPRVQLAAACCHYYYNTQHTYGEMLCFLRVSVFLCFSKHILGNYRHYVRFYIRTDKCHGRYFHFFNIA